MEEKEAKLYYGFGKGMSEEKMIGMGLTKGEIEEYRKGLTEGKKAGHKFREVRNLILEGVNEEKVAEANIAQLMAAADLANKNVRLEEGKSTENVSGVVHVEKILERIHGGVMKGKEESDAGEDGEKAKEET